MPQILVQENYLTGERKWRLCRNSTEPSLEDPVCIAFLRPGSGKVDFQRAPSLATDKSNSVCLCCLKIIWFMQNARLSSGNLEFCYVLGKAWHNQVPIRTMGSKFLFSLLGSHHWRCALESPGLTHALFPLLPIFKCMSQLWAGFSWLTWGLMKISVPNAIPCCCSSTLLLTDF